MIFKGIDLCDHLIITDIRRDLLPPIEFLSRDIPGKIGSKYIKDYIRSRTIEVDVAIEGWGNDKRQTIRNISGLLYSEDLEEIRFKDEIDKFYLGKLVGDTSLSELQCINETTLSFYIPFPLAYSKNKTAIADIAGKTIINQGTYKTTGQITVNINKDVDNLKVTLQNTGEFIYLEDNFKIDDEVVIDLEDESVRKNNNLIMDKLYYESDFFDIPIGEFKITLSSGIGNLEFRERWL